jgi:tellurite resistance protein TerC
VFIFAVLFNQFFKVPLKYQYRILFWGILGAIVMRLAFIMVGAAALKRWDWVLPAFGVLLIWQAIKMALQGEHEPDPEKTIIMRVCRRLLPMAKQDHGSRFVAREDGRWVITPLLLVLIVIEWTDVVFAVDSVPAIFGVTRDPFIVFTSNIFAIMGLRALYFLLAGATDMFRFLKYGLSGVLLFIGGDMVAEYVAHRFYGLPEDEHLVSHFVSLAVVVGLLAVSILASLLLPHSAKENTNDLTT